jgi:3',5'-cyclic AMP phosphodiesterase CpdA
MCYLMTRKRWWRLILLGIVLGVSYAWFSRTSIEDWWNSPGSWYPPDNNFAVKPYVQPGDSPNALALLWQTIEETDHLAWAVQFQNEPGRAWAATSAPQWHRLAVEGVPVLRLYRATLWGLSPGVTFSYRVIRAGAPVFEASATAPKPAGQSHRFVVFGDCGTGSTEQRAVAYQAGRARPDYVVITGDVVYLRGRASEYLDRFFPIYNAEISSPHIGTSLLRSTLFYAAPGNHDLIERNLDKHPDGLAFFYEWAYPLNGPEPPPGAPAGVLEGSAARVQAFRKAAGSAFPRMANYSFNYGDIHWTVLDGNNYADWTEPSFRSWLEGNLASARGAAWRLVALHHPPFHSSKAHADDQRTRVLAPIFEKGGVALVFAGHVHNYQRSRPLRFTAGPPEPNAAGKAFGPSGMLDGKWTLDKVYDGKERIRPDGVIYVVTGAGGARLYDTDQHDVPSSWHDFTARFVSNIHSLSIVDATPETLTVRQVSAEGAELDRFVVGRPEPPSLAR